MLSLVLIRSDQNLYFLFLQTPALVASNNVEYATETSDNSFAQMALIAINHSFRTDVQQNLELVTNPDPSLVIKMEIKEESVIIAKNLYAQFH